MKSHKWTLALILALLSLFFAWLNIGKSQNFQDNHYEEVLEGKILNVENSTQNFADGSSEVEQKLAIKITKGTLNGQTIEVFNSDVQSVNAQLYGKNDEVLIQRSEDPQSGENTFTLSEHIRRSTLYLLFGIFLVVVLIVSQKQGLESLIGMAFSFLVLFKWILPLLLSGYDPVLTAISGALFIIPITFYLSHGINKKTTLAIGGTILTLILTGVLAKIFVGAAHLTGLTDDAALYLKAETGNNLHFQGLLLAGIMISMLGILDDITISQAAVAAQLKELKPKIRIVELFSRTMEVGKDHIASVVNTLVLIYAGASLPLLLLFITNAHPFSEIINYEFVAEEIVQTLVGSIGLILAVPLTTLLASFYHSKK